jgi:hypothetical protein
MYTRQTFTDRIGSRDSQKRFALLIRPCWSDSINQSNGIINLSSELIRGSEGETYEYTGGVPRVISDDLTTVYRCW